MANELDWLDELPDYGAEQVLENEQERAENAPAPAPLPIPQMAGPSPEQRREELNAFLLSGRYEDAAVHERLKQNPELEDLSANVRRLDALNARAVQGQTVLRYAFPELGQEPGAYFLKRNKPLPECQTRTDAFAAVYDDYMAEVEGEYKQLLERRAAWQANKAVVSQAAADVVAGRVSPAALAERLSPEQHAVYTKEFDPVATEKAGVAMGMLRDAFSGSAEEGLKQMVDQGLANGVVAALSDADEESGELVLNEKAVGMFQGALFSLMKEAKEKSGDEYKFLHNMLLALGNPVRRRKKDLAELGFVGQTAERVEMLAATGQEDEAAAALEQMEETLRPLRSRWKNDAVYSRIRGMLDAAQSAGNETAETADFFAKTVNALGSVIGQTAPFFVPYAGTWVALAEAYDEKRNAAYFKGLKEGTAEWSAFIDAATSVTVEKIAFGGWGKSPLIVRTMKKIPGYGSVRNTLLGSFYARAALEVGAGVLEESALEPTAEALLQWGLRNVFLSWADVGGKYDWSEYAAELKQMFKPEQLAATVIFGAGLSGVQAPMIKAAAEGYSKHVEHLMAQGIGKETARNIAAMPDAGERVDAAIKARAEAWKDPQAAEANRLMAATMFREIEEARALYESRAYQEARRELNLPKVEKVIDKEGRYLVTTFDRADGHELFHGEVGEQQLLEMLGHYIQHEERMRIHRAQSAMGANALLRAAEKSGEVVVEDMSDAKNPESGEQVISEAGTMGLEEFKYAAELALDEMEARKASGMSEQEALATPFAALSRYMPLGHWLQLERAFQERLETARETTGEEGADSTRVLNVTPAAGTTKADTLLLAARGQVETREVLEDVIEHAQKKVTGNDPAKLRAWHALLRDAQKAVKQLGFKLNFYDGHDGLDAAALQGKITEGMSKLASAYTVVNADALPLPAWVKDLVKWHMRALEDAAAIVELAEAYKTGRERGNISQDIEDVLAEIGHKASSLFQSAELEAVDVQAYKDARARYRMLTGDMTPTASEVQAEQEAADAREQERVRPAEDVKSVLTPREDGSMDEQTFSPAGDLPEEVRGAFPKGACYNIGARAWLGMVPVARLHLSPDAPQVKVGSNKKGVVNPLVGDYRQDAPPVYVWQRRNGTLEVISGRHRLDLAKRTNTEMIAAYVYPEDAAHDAKWARLLDYEQNMQDDQADELTAAIYVRETQLSDEELTRRGLTRGGTKSARGILIGREAREDLWSRFQSRAIDPRMAEAICRLTLHMPDASRIDAMQAMAAADLAKGKSLEHVAAKLQLMAHADADGEATQGLLSFGESFDEALERSAEFIARSIEVINKHIAAVTKARSLGKGGVSEQEGISVGLDMDPKQRLAELNELKAAYEKCGFHEKIRFRALTWDGKSDVDPIGDYARDKAAAAELAGPTAEELEQQARDAAAEATGTFGFSTYAPRVLQRSYATDINGNKLDADTFITTPNGNLNWYEFPQDAKTQRLLASRRIKNLPIRLRVGKQNKREHEGFGLIHMLNHVDDYAEKGETPLLHLYNTLANLVKIRGGAYGRYDFKGEYDGNDSKLVAQLIEDDGCYSIVSCYPVQMNRLPQAGELVIGRVLFQFPPNSGTAQIPVGKSQNNAVTTSAGTNGQASTSNVAQSPAQVNIYDVQIRDSSGNVIFQQPVEAKANFSVASNLAAVHSLSPEKFLAALELGGMPMPSVAVTRLDKPYGWGGAGNIMLVGRPAMVDPKEGTEVYSADAWTGKFPRVIHKHQENADFKEAAKAAGEMEDKYGYVFYQLADKLRQADTKSDLQYLLETDNGKALFAYMHGYEPKARTIAKQMDYQFLDKQFAKETRNMWENGEAIKEGQELAFADAVEASLNRWLGGQDEKYRKLYGKLYGDLLSDLRSGRPYGVWFRLKMSLNNMGKRELDAHGNREMLAKYADKHKKAFAAWVNEKVDKWRSKDGYIRETGKVATLDNVLNFMLSKKGLNNEDFMGFSPGKLRAALSDKMRSLDDIKGRRERLSDSDTSKESKKQSEELMMEYTRMVRGHLAEAGADSFYAIDYGLESLSLVKGKPTVEKVQRAVRKVFSYTKAAEAMAKDNELLQAGVDAVTSVRAEIEDYMEAVPQRAVRMNEWEYAVMPESLKKNKAVMAGLRENGIRPRFHDGTEEGRKAALAGLVNNAKVSFSVVGENAANWEKIKHRAFKGRDDGKLRVELDASQAMFRSPSYRERVDEIKAFIEEQRELAVEDGRQRQHAELEARLDRLDEAMDSASEDEVSEILREYERIENERKDFRRKLYGEWRAVFPEIEMEEGDYLLLERAILGEKGASRTNNAVFRLASMRDNLGITPVERALHPKLEADRETIVAALKRLKESEVAQELKAVYDRTEAGERTEEMRARVEQLADDVRQEAVRLGVPERILRGKPWFRVHMELFERDAEDVADAALRTVLLEDVLDFPELYEAYPQLRDYRVYGDMLGSTAYRGMYDGWNAIMLNDMLGEQEVLGTLLHEVQHAIQKIEGFAKGSNDRNGMDAYMRSAGEIEARNVQARLNWTAEQRAARPFNETLEYPGEALVAFSVTSMSEAAQGLLEGSAMKVTRAADLIKDFNAQIANWNRVAASKEGRADTRTGAEMFGTVQALLSSARKVLPDGYRGNVHTLMQWASVYAGMAETGQLPAAGALKGNAKILDAFRKKMLNETAMAADNAEAEAMLASIGEQKLNEVMVKVLQQVRGQLAKFAKDELWAKMGKVIQHAKAKEEQGKKSKRGKMSAVDYEKLAKYEQYLAMDAETVREELDGLYGKLDKAEGDRAAKLEEEAGELSLYGGWKGMSLQQAVAAYQAMVLFCATGRSSWQQLLDKRKAEIEYLAREMGRALPTDRTASETRLAEHTKLRKALRRLPYGCMSYSQLMLALSSRLGEGFCFDRIQEMTDANAALLNAEKARMGWMYGLVQKVSGRKGELACDKWLADFDTPHDTGIVLSPMAWCEVEMTVEAAEDWLALGKEEREKQWAEREADEKRKKRNLRRERPMVPEALLPELRKAVKEYKENPRKSSGKVTVRGQYEDKGRARTLTCSRDGALYAILLHEQSDYQTVFGQPGEVMEAGLLYREGLNTPEKIRQLYDYVGPAGLRYGYALREKLHEQGLTVAQVFEAREGIPFKFRDNYFRASFDRLAVKEKNTVTDGKVNSMGGGKYGMLINRVAHHQEAAKWDMGASMVFLAASLEQDNYIFTSHITDRWRKLLLQREFATKLKAYLGDDVMNKLVCWLEVIDNAPLDNMRAFSNLSHWQGFFRGAWAASVLNGNGYVLMKQASALLHGYAAGYVPEAIKEQEDGVREVAHRHIGLLEFLGHAVAGGPISDKDLENSPYFQARRTAVGKGVSTQGLMDAGRKRSALALPSEKLGELIEKLDAWLNRKTARALANAFYAASKKLNEQHGGLLTEEQLREGALQAVGRMLELGAQPQTRTQKSIFQNGSGMLGKMTFAMKSESINKLGLMSAQAVRGERVSPVAAWVSFGLVNAAISFLISYLQGDDDDWKSDVATAATSTITGPLSAVPVLGEGIAALASLITGERVYSSNLGRQILDVEGIAAGAKRLYRHHADEREMTWEQYFQTITGLLRASGTGFGAFSRSGSEVLSSFGSLALSAAAGANVSRAGKDILCTVGLLDRPKKKENAKSRTKTKAGQRTKRRR